MQGAEAKSSRPPTGESRPRGESDRRRLARVTHGTVHAGAAAVGPSVRGAFPFAVARPMLVAPLVEGLRADR
jgi:hypothetical protein